MKRLIFIFLIFVAIFSIHAFAQAPENDSQPEKTKERQEYERILAEWKPMVAELSRLRYQYFDVKRKPGEDELMIVEDTPQRRELKKEFDSKFAAAEKKHDQLIDAAVLAFAKNPEQNRDIEGFLLYTLQYFMQHSMYEDAMKMSGILLNSKITNPYVIRAAAFSALYTQKYDTVRSLLEKIQKLGIMDEFKLEQSDFRYLPILEQLWEREKQLYLKDEQSDLPRVVLYTTKGEIEILLYEDQAPNTVANFIWLVEKGFYNRIDFDIVSCERMAHVGGTEQFKRVDNNPNSTRYLQPIIRGNGTPGYVIPDEFRAFDMETKTFPEDARFFWRGTVAMDLMGQMPNSAGCQFFIQFKPDVEKIGRYTPFGRVVRGMDALCRLQQRNPAGAVTLATLPTPDKIIEAKVINKRSHDYKPQIRPLEKTIPPYPNMPVEPGQEQKDPDSFDIIDYTKQYMP